MLGLKVCTMPRLLLCRPDWPQNHLASAFRVLGMGIQSCATRPAHGGNWQSLLLCALMKCLLFRSSCRRAAWWDSGEDPHLPRTEVQWHWSLRLRAVRGSESPATVCLAVWGGWGKSSPGHIPALQWSVLSIYDMTALLGSKKWVSLSLSHQQLLSGLIMGATGAVGR